MRNTSLEMSLKELKLSTMINSYADKASEASNKNWDYQEYLRVLCDEEISDRYNKKIQRFTRESSLPPLKTLDSFDFASSDKIKHKSILHIAGDATWVKNNENILLFGPSGVGKTHIASAIGHEMIIKGIRVKFMKAVAMIQLLRANS